MYIEFIYMSSKNGHTFLYTPKLNMVEMKSIIMYTTIICMDNFNII